MIIAFQDEAPGYNLSQWSALTCTKILIRVGLDPLCDGRISHCACDYNSACTNWVLCWNSFFL